MLKQKVQSGVLAVGAFSAMACCIAWSQQQYAVSQRFHLQQKTEGASGELQVLTDSRLESEVRRQMWGKGDWSIVLPPESELFREFSKASPGNAKLQIRSEANDLLSERILEAPLAELQEMSIDGDNNGTFLLTVDYTAGFGSYSGLVTTLLRVRGAKFHDLIAEAEGTHSHEPIRLVKSLKADWKMLPGSKHAEILSISCRAGQGSSFIVVYTRYYFKGGLWFERHRERLGFWESDEAFPARSQFP
jgi:hypothetical protein